MRDRKKFIFYATVLLIGYFCLSLLLPSSLVVLVWASIAGWTVGGWVWQLATKWSTTDDIQA